MMSRRTAIAAGLATGVGTLVEPALGATLFPVVETAQGKLRGLSSGGVAIFRGVHYAADTSGPNRFMPPRPLQNWAGIRDALHWGDVAPQVPGDRRSVYADLIMVDRNPSGMGENNLTLNLWTPRIDATAKKPVIVVLHGGGFYSGSGNSVGMDGEQMARFTDSVVIAINHRLGAFGFLHLPEFAGADFATSGTAGMQDIVAALAWVRQNVAEFGGDPSRVLVYGQSGGGAKTSVLMAMPSAKGLFHRAGVMSGSALRMMPAEMASAATRRLLAALDIAPEKARTLQQVPWTTLLETQAKLELADRARGEAPGAFAPVIDGTTLPHHPWDPEAPAVSADVPMIVSTALDERAYRMADFGMTEAGLATFAQKLFGDGAADAMAAYRAEAPDEKPFLLAARMETDRTFRKSAFTQAERKAQQGGAPVWAYLWKAPSPAAGGRFGAVHGIDVAPSLYNTRSALNGSSPEAVSLAAAIASSWAAFAANGTPDNPRIPHWPAYEPKRRATLIFDNTITVADDPRGAMRKLHG
ncbi:MAG: carboxylesterase [Novosphingobium sp. 17-62-19]|uniref:carboxylesterase/lipase family protein n=1 Tax=Novosphingobium sp. 17-62-19 TaxID=1970406 RepID=UPI000BCA5210|nr:carboxylesterase family protein [Novosphingobium sp. 17-62-19]OZA20181.1 MAG: carboxylesterase [Novosphingobium sp. 17-62-19]HQS96527.1 carboxylesterase family protein [Novosphingobium sp.]